MPSLILTLVSGEKINVTHVRLVNAELVEKTQSVLQELASATGRQNSSTFVSGEPTAVAGIIAAVAVVSWLSQKSQAKEVKRLTEELAQLIERIRGGGTFIPISHVNGISTPIPSCWYAEVTKRMRTENGLVEKTVRWSHSGDAFITFQLEDQRELTVFWDKVESVDYSVES